MNPYKQYQKQVEAAMIVGTRIDALLSLFDTACQRIEQALESMAKGESEAARDRRHRARLIVLGLWAGVVDDGTPVTTNLIRLYQFAASALDCEEQQQIRAALDTLRTLREGYQGIAEESRQLEREGVIPPLGANSAVHTLA